MKRTMMLVLFTMVAAASAFAQPPQQGTPAKPAEPAKTEMAKADATMPTIDQILDKYLQAIGGKAAHEKLTSRTQKGTFEIPAMGASGTAEFFEKAPNKTLAVITIPGFGVVQEGFNGTVAWSQNPQIGLREKAGSELADTKLESDFHKAIKLKQLYPKMMLKGKAKVGDKDAYVIEATPAEGSMEKWYFDSQSGLWLRTDAERETPEGKIAIETYYENYKDVDGIKLPFTTRITNPSFTFSVVIEEVKHNVAVDDAKFNKPAAQ